MSRRRVWVSSFLALAAVGSAWSFTVPMGGQPDEPAHVAKAAAIVRGEFTWDSRVDHFSTDPERLTISDIVLIAPFGYGDLLSQSLCLPPVAQRTGCGKGLSDDQTPTATRSTYVAAYPPVPYLAMGWPSLLLPTGRGVHAMRLCMVVLCSALLASAFTVARSCRRGRFLTFGVALAVTPMTLFLTSNANPNGLEVASSVACSVGLYALLTGATRRGTRDGFVLAVVTASGALLVSSRPASIGVLALVVFAAAFTFGTRDRLRDLAGWRATWAAATAVGAAAVGALWWFLYARPLDTVVGIPYPNPDFWANVGNSFQRLPGRAEEMVGVFSWTLAWPPAWVTWGWLALVGALVLAALVVGTWRQRVAMAGLVVAMCVLPTVAELPRVHELGFIWAGRYSLAFAVTVPLLAGSIIASARDRGEVPWWPASVRRGAVAAFSTFAGASVLASLGVTLSSYSTGAHDEILAFLGSDAVWSPKTGGIGSLALFIVAAALYGGWLASLLWPAERTGPASHRPSDAVGGRDAVLDGRGVLGAERQGSDTEGDVPAYS